jgi:hypothetical protein
MASVLQSRGVREFIIGFGEVGPDYSRTIKSPPAL